MKSNQRTEEVIIEDVQEDQVERKTVGSDENLSDFEKGYMLAQEELLGKPESKLEQAKSFVKKHKVAIGLGVLGAIGVGLAASNKKQPKVIEGEFVEVPEENFNYDSEYKDEEVKSEEA